MVDKYSENIEIYCSVHFSHILLLIEYSSGLYQIWFKVNEHYYYM